MDPLTAPPALRQPPSTRVGRQLYQLLPSVYRERDNGTPARPGDLARYLDAIGELLDRVRATLDQRLADSFPDNPLHDGRACQEWLLPYFAELVDARLVSPDARGRRDEVARAVDWRQRKGTMAGLEEIAEAVGLAEVEVQEGWKRVAVTPRVDAPLLPPEIYGVRGARALPGGGVEDRFDRDRPSDAARHPGLPAATVDFRARSGAVAAQAADPGARTTRFGGEPRRWRQANPHGVPCAPGSHQDVTRRTVDVRTPDWVRGHVHPRRLLLYTPPPLGFFGDAEMVELEAGLAPTEEALAGVVVRGTVEAAAPGVVIDGCAIEELVVRATGSGPAAAVVVRNSLLGSVRLEAPAGEEPLVEMEYCTVLGTAAFARLDASDCIFAGTLAVAQPEPSCVRYSRIPRGTPATLARRYGGTSNTDETPVFQEILFCDDGALVRRSARFGEPGCGVLHPATPEPVRLGAEDGGEMGAYHARGYALRARAVLDKLQDFLPVGMEAVLVPDPYLHAAPAEKDETPS